MRWHWLSILPLVLATLVQVENLSLTFLEHTRRRALVLAFSLGMTVACAIMAGTWQVGTTSAFLGQTWTADGTTQILLCGLYIVTALLIAISATTKQAEAFCASALACAGLFSATLLLRSVLLSSLLLPAALVISALATSQSGSSIRGAARFLGIATLPIPLSLACLTLLQRFTLTPDESVLVDLAALLVIPTVILWLTLSPFHGITRQWATEEVPLAPSFLWSAKDWIVVYYWLLLWRQSPMLHTDLASFLLGLAGVATVTISGISAYVQSNPSALLACAAMSELGIIVQGLATGSAEGLHGAILLLTNRTAAVMLGCAALSALSGGIVRQDRRYGLPGWRTLLPLIAFAISVLTLAGVPPLTGFVGRQRIYAALPAPSSYVPLLWLSASLGIVLGLVRTIWSLWHAQPQPDNQSASTLHLLLIGGLLLLCMYVAAQPNLIWSRSGLIATSLTALPQ